MGAAVEDAPPAWLLGLPVDPAPATLLAAGSIGLSDMLAQYWRSVDKYYMEHHLLIKSWRQIFGGARSTPESRGPIHFFLISLHSMKQRPSKEGVQEFVIAQSWDSVMSGVVAKLLTDVSSKMTILRLNLTLDKLDAIRP